MTTATIPHGTLTGHKYRKCQCLECYDAAAAYQARRYRQIGYGTWRPLVDAAPARAHIESLHAAGMKWKQIARHAGLYVTELQRLRMAIGSRPRTERIRPEREALLLSLRYVPVAPAPKALVSSVGTVRRLQALRAIGWTTTALADRVGVHRQVLGAVLRQDLVQAATYSRIAELYDDLHDDDPYRHGLDPLIVRRTIRAAAAQRWAPPNSWLNADIDDPDATPAPRRGCRYSTPGRGHRQRVVIESTAELALVGCTREEIAERLGITWEAVDRHHRRAGVALPMGVAS